MTIARRDCDVLVFQNADRAGRFAVILFVVLTGPLTCAVLGWQAMTSGGRFDPVTALGLLALMAGPFVLGYVFPYAECYAFERSSRQFMLAREYLLRKTRAELDFDQVRDVTVERVQAEHGDAWYAFMMLSDGRKIGVDSAKGKDSRNQCVESAAVLREFLGLA